VTRGHRPAGGRPRPGPLGPVDAVRVVEWAERARTAGHPVLEVRPGRFRPRPVPTRTPGMAPNDVLDIDRETARNQVAWVHVLMPSAGALLALGEAVTTPTTSRPAARPAGRPGAGISRRLPWRRTGGEAPVVGPVAVTETRGGVSVHVLEVPVTWLARPVLVIRRPAARTVVAP
jgi:hypothetical protein